VKRSLAPLPEHTQLLPGRPWLPAFIVTVALWGVLAPVSRAQQPASAPPGSSDAPKAAVPGPAASSSAPAKPASGPTGLDVYVLVKKLSRINAHAETAFSPSQSEKLNDLLEPLFEQPELDLREPRALLTAVRRDLNGKQVAALDAIQDITPQSVMPAVPAGPPPGPGPFGPPGGPPGGPPVDPSHNPRFNPFYTMPGVALTEQAARDLRDLLDALERAAPPVTARPARVSLRPSQKISVTTFHYDLARTGWNAKERVLTPRNVEKSRFGRLWHTPLDGQVYAAPLVVAGASVGGSTHDVIIAPTENNTVYALDADTGAVLWQQHLATPLADDEYNDCINITPLHGITSTPVIDLDRQEIYVCGLTHANLRQVYKVWALDLATGAVKNGWPVTLQGQYKGTPFDGGQLTQRGALTMVNGWLYIPFSSRCDIGEWHGWVMGVNARDPAASQRVFSPAPDASGGGIWGSAGLATDSEGNLYAVTGNGDYNLQAGGQSITEAILRLTAKDDLAFSYQPKDFYVPSNYQDLDQSDADLGGSSAIVLDQPGSATPHLLLTGGKDGLVYLVNRDNLGGIGGEIQKERLFGSEEGQYGSFIKTTPAYFEDGKGGQYVFVTGNDKGPGGTQGVVALKLGLDGRNKSQFKTVWSANRTLFQSGTAVVSSSGHDHAIVWVIESNKDDDNNGPPGVLHAYDALTGRELYHSNQREQRDSLGDARKFSAPTVANGRVYCGTDGVVAYGPIKKVK
jgi:outer membrane protein assembly factor BamB